MTPNHQHPPLTRVYDAPLESFARETIRAALAVLSDADLQLLIFMRPSASLTISKVLDTEIAESLLSSKDTPWPLATVVHKPLWLYLSDLVETAVRFADFRLGVARFEHQCEQLRVHRRALSRLATYADREAMQDGNGVVVSERIPLRGLCSVKGSVSYIDYSMECSKSEMFLDHFERLEVAAKWKQVVLEGEQRVCSHRSPNCFADHKDCLVRLRECYVRGGEGGDGGDEDAGTESTSIDGDSSSIHSSPDLTTTSSHLTQPIPLNPTSALPPTTLPILTKAPSPEPPCTEHLTPSDLETCKTSYNAILHTKFGNFVAELDSSLIADSHKEVIDAAKDMWAVVAAKGCHDRISWSETVDYVRRMRGRNQTELMGNALGSEFEII